MRSLYTIGINLYGLGIRIASLFHAKAKLWVEGRKNWRNELQLAIDKVNAASSNENEWIWFHCSSLGEFEQGRNLIEAIRTSYPNYKILLSFFSPSGFEIRKEYSEVNHVCYLPLDTPGNVRYFLDTLQPKMAFFIKYDIWVNYLLELEHRNIPCLLVSAFLKEKSSFLSSPIRSLYKKAFRSFLWIFSQDQNSLELLEHFTQKPNISISGDTRFDRALSLLDNLRELPEIAAFKGSDFCIIAGSPWPKDEEMLLRAWQEIKTLPVKLILAPHEIDQKHIQQIVSQNPGEMLAWSNIAELKPEHKVLWIDNVGMLSALYRYADLVYIGGGFGKSIHNTQEPAAYGNPVAFGPKYQMFKEAVELVALNCAFSIESAEEFVRFFKLFYEDEKLLADKREQISAYMHAQGGATSRVMDKLKELELFL